MVTIKSEREIELMREAGKILAKVHEELGKVVRPGISTKEIDRICEEMIRSYGCDPAHIRAAIGPGIGPCCFETHADVPDAMTAAFGPSAQPYLRALPGGKFQVDLKGLNALALSQAGLDPRQIDLDHDCTACRPEKYWSHRRVGQQRGSMAAMIQLV